MIAISLKLPADVLEASRRQAKALQISRAEYMRRAIQDMNRKTRQEIRARRLATASHKVRGESLEVNAEFARVERDPDA